MTYRSLHLWNMEQGIYLPQCQWEWFYGTSVSGTGSNS